MQSVKTLLNPLFDRYNRVEFLSSDPLEFTHRFQDPWDQEVVGLFGALLAYGNVKAIRASMENLLSRVRQTGMKPSQLIRGLGDEKTRELWKKALTGFKHRLYVGADIFALTRLVHISWREHGSIGAHLAHHRHEGDPDFSGALARLLSEWKTWIRENRIPKGKGFGHLIPSPEDGSTCKRWCMYLRWMIRKDELDLGLWSEGSPLLDGRRAFRTDQLIMPLDTHTGRISQYIGLTNRKSLNWLAALEVTEALREVDLADPVKYDFALARLGILDLCQKKYREEICEKCELKPACRFANRARNRRRER